VRNEPRARPYSHGMRLPSWKHLATPGRLDLLIAAGLLAWGLPDVPWWWEYPGHAGSTPDILGSLALTAAMSVPFCWRRALPVPVLALAAGVLAARAALGTAPAQACRREQAERSNPRGLEDLRCHASHLLKSVGSTMHIVP